LSHEHFKKIFELVGEKVLEKEAIEIIFESIMSGKAESIEESIQKSSLKNISDEELEKILEVVVQDNLSILQNQGSHAIGTLMGIAMKTVRGKASGEKVNQILKKKIQDHLNKK
jgi:glutamyl-tRNA(Gln) amidotransferase subunit E